MELLHPGVYVQEISSGSHPIEGVSTSTTAFIGKAEKGALDRAVMVTSFAEFQRTYGGFLKDSYLAHAALQFYNNGGKRLHIVRVAKNAETAKVTIKDRQEPTVSTLTVSAISPGKWGNDLDAVIADGTQDSGDEFKITVKQAGGIVEVYDDLSMNPDALNFVENKVNARSNLIRIAVDPANDSPTKKGTSVSGAAPLTSLPPPAGRKFFINLNGDGFQTVTLDDPCTTGPEIAAAIQKAVRLLKPLRGTPVAAFASFTAAFATGVYTLTSGTGGKLSSVEVANDNQQADNAAMLLQLGTTNGGTETTGAAILRPALGAYNVGVTPGSDGSTPQDIDYMNGFQLLDVRTDVNIVAVPGIGTKAVVEFGSSYCAQRMDCVFVADMAATDDTKEEAQSFVGGLSVKSSYAAIYFPWLKMTDPTGISPEPILVPPSGFVTGMYAQIDGRRGVWKSPAGTEANLGGAVGLARNFIDAEQDTLNPIGANLIRSFPAYGTVIWGARTLATQRDPEYRYVPVRRMAVFLERSIYNGIQWVVFEPNDEPLWAQIRLNVGSFMHGLFRQGAFAGKTPNDAYLVRCDKNTTTPDDVNQGIVNIIVGFAPLKPAEFVVLKIQQLAGQTQS